MGKLTFANLEISLLSSDAALVFGKWELTREQDKSPQDRPQGLFTLTFRKMPQGWKIIHDHTSSGN
jgi:ketosteroid isomerase-like protein